MILKDQDQELESIQGRVEDLVEELPDEEPALTNIISELGFIRTRLAHQGDGANG